MLSFIGVRKIPTSQTSSAQSVEEVKGPAKDDSLEENRCPENSELLLSAVESAKQQLIKRVNRTESPKKEIQKPLQEIDDNFQEIPVVPTIEQICKPQNFIATASKTRNSVEKPDQNLIPEVSEELNNNETVPRNCSTKIEESLVVGVEKICEENLKAEETPENPEFSSSFYQFTQSSTEETTVDVVLQLLKEEKVENTEELLEFQEYACSEGSSEESMSMRRISQIRQSNDSAKGSSIADIEHHFYPGQLLWTTLKIGTLHWPSIVYPGEDGNCVIVGKNLLFNLSTHYTHHTLNFFFPGNNNHRRLRVRYFNDNGRYGFIPLANTIQFAGEEDYLQNVLRVKKMKNKPGHFSKSNQRAVAEANFLYTNPHIDPIAFFDEIIKNIEK